MNIPDSARPTEGFYPDPTGRNEGRFWNGQEWTSRVESWGYEIEDTMWVAFPPPPAGERFDPNQKVAAATQEGQRNSAAYLIAIVLGSVLYGLAAYFAMFWWALLATSVYYLTAFFVFPIPVRASGLKDHRRVELFAMLLAVVPTAVVAWIALESVGFRPHGDWCNVAWWYSCR